MINEKCKNQKFENSFRSKTSNTKEKYLEHAHQKSQTEQSNRLNSTRSNPRKIAGITGINTYHYEVTANPMKESFLHSIQKRKKFLKNSIKDCKDFNERSKTGIRSRYVRLQNHQLLRDLFLIKVI